jgi:hypothetical protein
MSDNKPHWDFIQNRTAAEGAVFTSSDGNLIKRIGGQNLLQEASVVRRLGELAYPVPEVVSAGQEGDSYFYIEKSLGSLSFHQTAREEMQERGQVQDETLHRIIGISERLLEAQVGNSRPPKLEEIQDWFQRASYIGNVFNENPDLDTERTRRIIQKVVGRLSELPVSPAHMDYGLPNTFEQGVIDWQHESDAPVGYDVYPMLEIVPFKGGRAGYSFTKAQREEYTYALDKVAHEKLGAGLSEYMGDFLVVKSFFFLALMKPENVIDEVANQKWQYRRQLLKMSLDQYSNNEKIDTSEFPTLKAFQRTAGEGMKTL